MIETRAPGKLFIVGEYAVVEPGQPAVLVAVDRFITVRLSERSDESHQAHSPHVQAAIRAVEDFRRSRGLPRRFFEIEIASELDESDGRKFGLGSSAAVTVATIEAVARFYGLGLSTFERFQLAFLATIEISAKASGGDLAASTYGGWVRYSSPDRDALRQARQDFGVLTALKHKAWELCEVRRLPAPQSLRLLVGWTGRPASTEHLVDRVTVPTDLAAEASMRTAFLARSREYVETFTSALEVSDLADSDELACSSIRQSRELLASLSQERGITIETELLSALCEIAESHGAAAKSSGAGGGDCGISLAGLSSEIPEILREWEARGITPLNVEVFEPSLTLEGANDGR